MHNLDLFHETITRYKNKDKMFVVQLATLIEQLLKYYFYEYAGINYELLGTKLSRMIMEFTYDQQFRDDIFFITNLRNDILHRGLDFKSDYMLSEDMNRFFLVVNDIIDKIQNDTKKKLNFYFYDDLFLNHEDKKELEKAIASKELTFEKVSYIKYDSKSGIAVPTSYFPDNSVLLFEKPDIKDSSLNYVFKAIYNILSRNRIISLSDYLETLVLEKDDYSQIYALEIQILMHTFSNPSRKYDVEIDKKHTKLIEYAINDLNHYYNNYAEMMVENPADFPSFNVSPISHSDTGIISITIDKHRYNIKNAYGYVSSQKFITSSLNYPLYANAENKSNWDFFTNIIFGYDYLKNGQYEIISSYLSNSSKEKALCGVLPTGYGKSAIYQLISFIYPKVSFLVTPTKLLQTDQLYNLRDVHQNNMATDDIIRKDLSKSFTSKLLYYVTADELFHNDIRKTIKYAYKNKVFNQIIIDEVHQLSMWSHNFDVNYLNIPTLIKKDIPNSKILMTTATANQRVQDDLNKKFSFKEINYIIPSLMKRDNIKHFVKAKASVDEIVQDIIDELKVNIGTGNSFDIDGDNLYMIINNNVDVLKQIYNEMNNHAFLRREVILNTEYSEANYELFRNGVKKILISTDEFSIGVNIPRIKNIITISTPLSKEWFYQETGRVSRNDKEGNSVTYLLINDDVNVIQNYNNNIVNILDAFENVKNLNILSNMQPYFEVFNDRDKELKNMNKIIHGIEKTAINGKVNLSVPIEGKKFYSNSLNFSFIMNIIKDWEIIDDGEDFTKYAVKVERDIRDSVMFEHAKSYVALNSVHNDITNEFLDLHTREDLKLIFIDWYYKSKTYQQFDSMYYVFTMLEEYINKSNISKQIEDELTNVFIMRNVESRYTSRQNKKAYEPQDFDKVNIIPNNTSVERTEENNKTNGVYDYSQLELSSDDLNDERKVKLTPNVLDQFKDIFNNKHSISESNNKNEKNRNNFIETKKEDIPKSKDRFNNIISEISPDDIFEIESEKQNGRLKLNATSDEIIEFILGYNEDDDLNTFRELLLQPNFMNGRNDDNIRIMSENLNSSMYRDLYIYIQAYYEYKNNRKPNRIRSIINSENLDFEDFMESIKGIKGDYLYSGKYKLVELLFQEFGVEYFDGNLIDHLEVEKGFVEFLYIEKILNGGHENGRNQN